MTVADLPAGVWHAALRHSRDHPTHILGPYESEDGVIHMDCVGDGDDPYERNCDFDTADAEAPS